MRGSPSAGKDDGKTPLNSTRIIRKAAVNKKYPKKGQVEESNDKNAYFQQHGI
jgi:hypothetical protein